MVDSLLYPLLVATITTVGVGLLRGRGREALERRIGFYGSDEARQNSARLSKFQATQRIRCQARLMALDHVRRTAEAPLGFFIVMAGGYLFAGWRTVASGASPQGESTSWIVMGVVCALVGAHAALALIRSFHARGAIIRAALAGRVPSGPSANPLEEWIAYRPVWRAVALYVAMLIAPSALGAAVGSMETSPSGRDALLLVLGMSCYAVIALALAVCWREMDKAVHGEITAETVERFRVAD